MRKFKIIDKNRTLISLEQLNQEAAELWNVNYVKEESVTPNGDIYDHLHSWNFRFSIAMSNLHTADGLGMWERLTYSMIENHIHHAVIIEGGRINEPYEPYRFEKISFDIYLNYLKTFLQPYLNLINHWGQKGYQIIFTD